MVVGTIFQASLNADKIYIDMTYLPDPITHKFWLTIKNQSVIALYFKIINNIANWTLTDPADGKLGSVNGGSETTFAITMTRANPGVETMDSGTLVIEAYTDSDYTNKISEDTLNVTVYIEDLESWPDVIKSDFDDGTAQGWTLGPNVSISNDESVEVGGYSAKFDRGGEYNTEAYIEKTVTLPNRNKVRVSFYIAVHIWDYGEAHDLSVLVNGEKVFDIPHEWYDYKQGRFGWLKITADLSEYRGQTVTLRIRTYINVHEGYNENGICWFDRIVIAGKD